MRKIRYVGSGILAGCLVAGLWFGVGRWQEIRASARTPVATVVTVGALQFIRKSKTSEAWSNIKAIGDGAISWFDAEHADKNGVPSEKHFPNDISPNGIVDGTYVNPIQKPCANGNPLYPKNPSIWQKEPWLSMKFGINKPHYFQYVYIASGTGTSAKFTIRAHADLDCDGTFSTYEVRAFINQTTGEVERSKLRITNALE